MKTTKTKTILVQIGRKIYELKEIKELYIKKGEEAKMIDFLTRNSDLRVLVEKEVQ
jgi:hypothetical protein